MNAAENMNLLLADLLQDADFMQQYRAAVIVEKNKVLEINAPLDVLSHMLIERDELIEAAALFVDMSNLSWYVLSGVLMAYVKKDTRCSDIRNRFLLVAEHVEEQDSQGG